jgi:hypothetical protein
VERRFDLVVVGTGVTSAVVTGGSDIRFVL